MNRRILSLFLVLSMCIGISAMPAYAAEIDDPAEQEITAEDNTDAEEETLPEETPETAPDESDAAPEEDAAEQDDSSAAEDSEEDVRPEEDEEEIDSEEADYAKSGTFGSLTYSLNDNGELTITGSGAMTNFASESAVPWYSFRTEIRKVTLPSGLTSIGSYAFAGCTSLTEVYVPDTVTTIGTAAFSGCSGLQNVYFRGSAPTIASNAFSGVGASVYYVETTGTWSSTNKIDYGGALSWVSWVLHYDDVVAFVTRLYNICLEREPDEKGLNYWVENLISGKITGKECVIEFYFSGEYRNKNYCNACFVRSLYRGILGREADDKGLTYWVNSLKSGDSRINLANNLMNSAEFKNLCASYNIVLGDRFTKTVKEFGTSGQCGSCKNCITHSYTEYTVINQGTKEHPVWIEQAECDRGCGAVETRDSEAMQFVIRLYRTCLGREPDAKGLNAWVSDLEHNRCGASTVVFEFFFSAEYKSMNTCNSCFVNDLYQVCMNRDSDTGGYKYWTTVLNAGDDTRFNAVNNFLDSGEFRTLCGKYGIDPGGRMSNNSKNYTVTSGICGRRGETIG